MIPDRHARIGSLFLRARQVPREGRAAFLDTECASDPLARDEVASLLAHDEAPMTLLRTAGHGGKAHGAAMLELVDRLSRPWRPSHIGEFRVLRWIGEGSTATVFEAEQAAPRRRVAVKALRPGAMRGGAGRFERECRLLASLEHPGIARVYSVGVGVEGSIEFPFLVMELVPGPSLTRYARERALGARQCAELMVRVCAAVEHAHQRGVIHRDLKPSNILVDAEGHPKVLDFGLAKVVHQGPSAGSVGTATGEIVGTIAYMSPEQAQHTERVDTRSDIYSLGSILLELLTGKPVHDVAGMRMDAALAEVRQERPVSVDRIKGALGADLRSIIVKACRHDMDQRYGSVSELRADLARAIAGGPVLARAPSAGYYLRAYVSKNRGPVSLAAAVFAVVISLALIAWSQATKVDERTHAARTTGAAFRMLARGGSYYAKSGPGVRVEDRLLELAERIPELCKGQRRTEAELRTALGEALMGVDRFTDAEASLRRAEALWREEDPSDSLPLLRTRGVMARVAHRLGHEQEAEAIEREVLWRLGGRPGVPVEEHARLLVALASTIGARGDYREALALLDRARALGNDLDEDSLAVCATLMETGSQELGLGLVRSAESHLLDAERRLRHNGSPTSSLPLTLSVLGQAYLATGETDKAEGRFREVIRIMSAIEGAERPSTGLALSRLAGRYWVAGDYGRAEPLFREAVRICRAGRATPAQLAETTNSLGVCLRDMGRYDEAESLLSEALSIRRAIYGNDHGRVADTETSLARLLVADGCLSEARLLAEHAAGVRSRYGGPVERIELLAVRAQIATAEGDPSSASLLAAEALALRRASGLQAHWRTELAVWAAAEAFSRAGCELDAQRLLFADLLETWTASGPDAAPTNHAWVRARDGLASLAQSAGQQPVACCRISLPPEYGAGALPTVVQATACPLK